MNALETGCGESVLKSVFLEQLTPSCRAALAISNIIDLKLLAEAADKYMDSMSSSNSQISTVDKETVSMFHELRADMARINSRLDSLEINRKGSSNQKGNKYRGRSKSRNRDKSSNPPLGASENFCYLHKNFGDKARYCRGNCSWKSPNTEN